MSAVSIIKRLEIVEKINRCSLLINGLNVIIQIAMASKRKRKLQNETEWTKDLLNFQYPEVDEHHCKCQ